MVSSSDGEISEAGGSTSARSSPETSPLSGDRLVVTGALGRGNRRHVSRDRGHLSTNSARPATAERLSGSTCMSAHHRSGSGRIESEPGRSHRWHGDRRGSRERTARPTPPAAAPPPSTSDGFDMIDADGVQRSVGGDRARRVARRFLPSPPNARHGSSSSRRRDNRRAPMSREPVDLGPRGRTVHFTQSCRHHMMAPNPTPNPSSNPSSRSSGRTPSGVSSESSSNRTGRARSATAARASSSTDATDLNQALLSAGCPLRRRSGRTRRGDERRRLRRNAHSRSSSSSTLSLGRRATRQPEPLGIFGDVERTHTRVVDGAGLPQPPGFAGAKAVYSDIAALAAGESPTEWKPSVRWATSVSTHLEEIYADNLNGRPPGARPPMGDYTERRYRRVAPSAA